jgi:hypothetical protein
MKKSKDAISDGSFDRMTKKARKELALRLLNCGGPRASHAPKKKAGLAALGKEKGE